MRWLAIDKDDDTFRMAILEGTKRSFTIKQLFSWKNHFFTEENVKQLYKEEKIDSITTSIPSHNLLLKNLFVEYTKKRGLEKILPFQVETTLSIPLSECLYKPILKNRSEKGVEFSLLVTKKESLLSHLEEMNMFHIDPDVVSCHPAALARFTTAYIKEKKPLFIVHLGWKKSLCLVVDKGIPLQYHTWKGGMENLMEALHLDKPHIEKKDLLSFAAKIDLLDLPETSHLFSALSLMKRELKKLFFAMEKKENKLLFTGNIFSFLHVEEALSEGDLIEENIDSEKKTYAVSIGMALDCLKADTNSLQFRKNDFLSLKQKKKIFSFLLGTASLILFLSSVFFCIGKAFLYHQEKKLQDSIQILQKLDPDLPSHPDLETQILLIEEKLDREKKPSSFLFSYPRVSETLSSLKNSTDSDFQLLSFHYGLQTHLQGKNNTIIDGVKVEIECKTSQKSAKKLREVLQKNPLIDTRKEIKWEEKEDHYKTSFFLKKKDPYEKTH